MVTDRQEHWKRTQLPYDGEVLSYSTYTYAVIRRGHRLVIELCERLARAKGGPLTILDIGCGWTDFYRKLEHITGTYVGIEPAEGQILRSEPRPNKFLIRGAGEQVLLADGCVDVVLLISVLDHCLDADLTIREAFRVLRPGGTVLVLLENRGRFSNDIRAMLGREISHGEEHLYYFSVDDLLELVKPHGRIAFLRSYGFLLGFDWVSRVLPTAVVSGLAAVADAVLGPLFSKKGQHFLVAVSKDGTAPPAPLAFRCPHCGAAMAWSSAGCGECGRPLRWIGAGILDVLLDAR